MIIMPRTANPKTREEVNEIKKLRERARRAELKKKKLAQAAAEQEATAATTPVIDRRNSPQANETCLPTPAPTNSLALVSPARTVASKRTRTVEDSESDEDVSPPARRQRRLAPQSVQSSVLVVDNYNSSELSSPPGEYVMLLRMLLTPTVRITRHLCITRKHHISRSRPPSNLKCGSNASMHNTTQTTDACGT